MVRESGILEGLSDSFMKSRTWSTSIHSKLIIPALFTLLHSLVLERGLLESKLPAGTSLWLLTLCQRKGHFT